MSDPTKAQEVHVVLHYLGVAMLVAVIGLVATILAAVYSGYEISAAELGMAGTLAAITSSLIGGLVGFIGGRAYQAFRQALSASDAPNG